ncbi:hypothetical protein SCLCIDRAFT_716188 [Scleroderma citrinum Foug A]|uniref:Uncharacterized protein n=1 Tax=Scleroderma citrinum Foug A TaxID=1036808 RepID=A0A0C3EP92_9AGAM|nr:hypothetical protein SCLCIDRAFT_716188 [Scleroderma citrinum Foug A]
MPRSHPSRQWGTPVWKGETVSNRDMQNQPNACYACYLVTRLPRLPPLSFSVCRRYHETRRALTTTTIDVAQATVLIHVSLHRTSHNL